MDPITIAIIAFVGTAVVTIAALSVKKLGDWFRARSAISASNRKKIGVLLTSRLNSHSYVEVPGVFTKPRPTQLVQAIYDTETDQVLDARALSSGEVKDPSLVEMVERGDGMVVFS